MNMSKVRRARGVALIFLYLLAGGFWAYSVWTKPALTDFIEVRSIEVVALDHPLARSEGLDCYDGGTIKANIEVGDPLFVAADIRFLQSAPGQYRTKMRNVTHGVNVYDDRDWSISNSYGPASKYCPFHSLHWWIGKDRQPRMAAGAHRLFTEFKFKADGGREVGAGVLFPSSAFIITDPRAVLRPR